MHRQGNRAICSPVGMREREGGREREREREKEGEREGGRER